MKIGKLLYGLSLVFVAVLIIGCATSGGASGASWKRVRLIDDVVGKWEGSVHITVPENHGSHIPETSIEVSVFIEYLKGDDEVTGGMKVDMNRFLTDYANGDGMRQLGLTKDHLWEIMADEFEKDDSMVVGGKYYVISDLSGSVDEFLNDSAGYFMINDSRTQLKMVFNQAVSFGFGDTGFKEIVLNRK